MELKPYDMQIFYALYLVSLAIFAALVIYRRWHNGHVEKYCLAAFTLIALTLPTLSLFLIFIPLRQKLYSHINLADYYGIITFYFPQVYAFLILLLFFVFRHFSHHDRAPIYLTGIAIVIHALTIYGVEPAPINDFRP